MNWQSDSNETLSPFSETLINWYNHHRRDLPWRHTRDPYPIWLSEIILQQTRVAQGMPYYHRFLEAYPTIQDMAAADERDLLRLWQGLGYYSRARNMHQTARLVVGQFEGRFPETYQQLLQLKGIGTYTAAAIASFAFGEKVAVVDGNVYRVLARVFGITEDITTTQAKKTFTTLANQLIQPTDDPATFNQALMEFGAIQCTPVAPDCLLCPFQQRCQAFQTGRQHLLPVKTKKQAVRERYFNYLVIEQNGRIAMKERRNRDVWQHLYDFALVETDEPVEAFRQLTDSDIAREVLQKGFFSGEVEERIHVLSHQRIRAKFWKMTVSAGEVLHLSEELKFYELAEIEHLPKSILVADYLKSRFF